MNNFYFEFLKMTLVFLGLALLIVGIIVVCICIVNRKGKIEKTNQYIANEITDDALIVHYKIRMSREKFSNHSYIKSNENEDVYDKLATGSVVIDDYVKQHEYNIDDVFRRTYG